MLQWHRRLLPQRQGSSGERRVHAPTALSAAALCSLGRPGLSSDDPDCRWGSVCEEAANRRPRRRCKPSPSKEFLPYPVNFVSTEGPWSGCSEGQRGGQEGNPKRTPRDDLVVFSSHRNARISQTAHRSDQPISGKNLLFAGRTRRTLLECQLQDLGLVK